MKLRFLFSLTAWCVASGLYALLVRTYADEQQSMLAAGSWSLFVETWLISALIIGVIDHGFNAIQSMPTLRQHPIILLAFIRAFFLLTALTLAGWLLLNMPFIDIRNRPPDFFVFIFEQRGLELLSALTYCLFCSLIISIVQHANYSIGSGKLINLIAGKYLEPKIEDKLIMFLDLKGSMQHAEVMGTLEFAHLLQDFFVDLNAIAEQYGAEIHKYIGDEAILVWDLKKKKQSANCLPFFFAMQERITLRKEHYRSTYAMLPEFKAGVNCGHITVTEIGIQKREIAYLSEAMHTTARLQSACNDLGESLLVSRCARDHLAKSNYSFAPLGYVELKGKRQPVEVFGVRQPEV